MLKYKADWRSLAYMVVTTALLIVQWSFGFYWALFVPSLFLGIAVAVMAHNHNHVPMWKANTMNVLTDYWLTLFYGFPAFAWIPTHNRNHHALNNREGDFTITYRVSEKNNIFTLTSYPPISSYFQQMPIRDYLRDLWVRNRTKFYQSIFQYVALAVFVGVALLIDWRKALLFIVIPQQVALFSILVFNYVQHVHADEESDYNHSRNFVGPMLNIMLFNNGFHTAHHLRANTHWSETPEAHAKIDHLIVDELKERSFWGYIFRAYFLALVFPRFETKSMRLARLAAQQQQSQSQPIIQASTVQASAAAASAVSVPASPNSL